LFYYSLIKQAIQVEANNMFFKFQNSYGMMYDKENNSLLPYHVYALTGMVVAMIMIIDEEENHKKAPSITLFM
jgi:hypothetical protein